MKDAVKVAALVAGVTELFPKWVAPNLITMAGTMGLVIAYIVFLIYLPDLQGKELQCANGTTSALLRIRGVKSKNWTDS